MVVKPLRSTIWEKKQRRRGLKLDMGSGLWISVENKCEAPENSGQAARKYDSKKRSRRLKKTERTEVASSEHSMAKR
jgi:hypothetical protein